LVVGGSGFTTGFVLSGRSGATLYPFSFFAMRSAVDLYARKMPQVPSIRPCFALDASGM
jgi:hypothetical protein